jgi:hypothetical protein
MQGARWKIKRQALLNYCRNLNCFDEKFFSRPRRAGEETFSSLFAHEAVKFRGRLMRVMNKFSFA